MQPKNFPKRYGLIKVRSLPKNSQNFAKRMLSKFTQQEARHSLVAERCIRTFKTIVFKYLHERDTNRYVDQLEKFVSIINNRINRMTELAPMEVSKKDVPYLISLAILCHHNDQSSKSAIEFAYERKWKHFKVVTGYSSLKSFLQFHTYLQKIRRRTFFMRT